MSGYAKKTIRIANEDISAYSIVCPEDSTPNEKFAAEQLRKYLGAASGVCPELLREAVGATDGRVISVGMRACADNPVYDDCCEEGFATAVDANGRVRIAGGRARGTLYGVYAFLEDFIGWRFLTGDCEYLKPGDINIQPPLLDVQLPRFEWRDVCSAVYDATDIASKRRINSSYLRNFSPEQGGSFLYPGRFIHTMESLLGVPQHTQPCYSDENNIKKCIESVRALLRANPDARVISVTQNDADVDEHTWCTCERCSEIDQREGSHAATLLRFVNAVGEAIEEEFPLVKLITLAYLESVKCPAITRPRKNVIVEFAPITLCYIHAANDTACQTNSELLRDFCEWSAVTDKIYIWDYIVNFSFTVPIFPDFQVLRQNIAYYAENSVTGMFCEGDNYQAPGTTTDLSELRAYLLSKLLWKPDMSEEEYNACRDDFLIGYYGEGGKAIGRYIDAISDIVSVAGHHIHCFNNPTTLVPKERFVERIPELEKYWLEAHSAACGECRERVERSRLQFIYLKLLFTFDDAVKNASEDERRALCDENESFYRALVKYDVRPRGMSSKLPQLDDFTQNAAVKIYW